MAFNEEAEKGEWVESLILEAEQLWNNALEAGPGDTTSLEKDKQQKADMDSPTKNKAARSVVSIFFLATFFPFLKIYFEKTKRFQSVWRNKDVSFTPAGLSEHVVRE